MTKSEFIEKYNNIVKQINSLEHDRDVFKVIETNQDVFSIIAKRLSQIINQKDVNIVYQPQIKDFKCVSCEALSRFKIDDITIAPNIAFLTASFYGFEEDLALTDLEQVCKDFDEIKNSLGKDFVISYNISPNIFNKSFCNKFYEILDKYSINPKYIGVELLEVSSFKNIKLKDFLYMQSKGTKIYLDDFGAGYANLDTFKHFPFDCLKFNGSLITDIANDKEKQNNLKNIINLCKQRTITTIAEKVENIEDAQTCYNLGVDAIQGYYFSRPITKNQLIDRYGKTY